MTRVMVVVAHPDDPEFLCGGTIAALVAGGAQVAYLVCTDGRLGSDDPAIPAAALVATRRAEQEAAARVLGVAGVAWLGWPDGELCPTPDLRRAIAAELRRYDPELVITHHPSRVLTVAIEASHPDHLAVGEATLAALASGPPREAWVVAHDGASHPVDVSAHVERKELAIRCHASQLGGGDVPGWVRFGMAVAGARAGCPYAEEFVRVAAGQARNAVGCRGW